MCAGSNVQFGAFNTALFLIDAACTLPTALILTWKVRTVAKDHIFPAPAIEASASKQ